MRIKADFDLPDCYAAFAESSDLHKDDGFDVRLVKTDEKPDLSDAVAVAQYSSVKVWQKAGCRIFWEAMHNGFLTVGENYTYGEFYCVNSDCFDSLKTLLQTMLECALISRGFLVLHAACIEKDGMALAFSAASGTGKSERAACWVKNLGAKWISGDRPAINPLDGIAYGVPWDGKEQIFVNTRAPIKALVELRRSGKTYAREMTNKQKTNFLASQLMIPLWDIALTQKVFIGVKNIINNIPVYRLYCDITYESAEDSYDILFNHTEKILEEKVEKNMKLKKGFEIVEIAGDFMAVPVGDNMVTFGGSVVLNEVSAFLLKNMKNSVTQEELLQLMTNEYDVDEQTAAQDLKDIIAVFEKIGLIE